MTRNYTSIEASVIGSALLNRNFQDELITLDQSDMETQRGADILAAMKLGVVLIPASTLLGATAVTPMEVLSTHLMEVSRRALPQLTVLGGCCGTDHRHIAAIAAACFG